MCKECRLPSQLPPPRALHSVLQLGLCPRGTPCYSQQKKSTGRITQQSCCFLRNDCLWYSLKLLNSVANQNRTWDRLFCIANLGLYKGCWGEERVAPPPQARIQTLLPAGLQAPARSTVPWLHYRSGANSSPCSSKRGISTLKLKLLTKQEGGTVKERGGLVSRPTRSKLEAPTFSSPARQPNILSQGEKKKNKQNPCHPLTCPSGNQEKFHLCKQKQ